MTGHYKCTHCGVTTRHDHEGNGCHACGAGVMRFTPDPEPPLEQRERDRQRHHDEDPS